MYLKYFKNCCEFYRTNHLRKKASQDQKEKHNNENDQTENRSNLEIEHSRSIRIPRHLNDEDKELYSIISRDVIAANEKDNRTDFSNVIGLVSNFLK